MALIKNSRVKHIGQMDEDEAPIHIQSEGEKLIKELSKKQTSTEINLEDELTREREFKKAEYIPITQFISGKTTLEEFQASTNFVNRIEELKSLGLTNEDIKLLLDNEKGDEYVKSVYNIPQSILAQRLAEIHKKLHMTNERKNDPPTTSRTDEEQFLLKPNSTETKLLKFALSNQPKKFDVRPPSHPINHIRELENDLFDKTEKPGIPPLAKRRKRFKKLEKEQRDSAVECISDRTTVGETTSKWDLKVAPSVLKPHVKEVKNYTCKPQTLYTIKDNKIVKIRDTKSNQSSIDNISTNDRCERLTNDQIKQLPRFQNYQKGVPSNILYIKNLSPKITEEDLISVFDKHKTTDHQIGYRLLTGKMKGQAFVTFHDQDSATKALDGTNGLVMKGKPMIIQYGRKTHDSSNT